MENNWKFKTLENLEKDVWATLDSEEGSHLIITCNNLRKKILNDFTIEDLRIMIGQSIGLKYLIPITMQILEGNILSEGDCYEGDLLMALLSSDKSYWQAEKQNHETICNLFNENEQVLKDFDTIWEIKQQWRELFEKFKTYNQ